MSTLTEYKNLTRDELIQECVSLDIRLAVQIHQRQELQSTLAQIKNIIN